MVNRLSADQAEDGAVSNQLKGGGGGGTGGGV
jgi:hypothetical protein